LLDVGMSDDAAMDHTPAASHPIDDSGHAAAFDPLAIKGIDPGQSVGGYSGTGWRSCRGRRGGQGRDRLLSRAATDLRAIRLRM
jgi:hypothetical protein